jgi:glutaredoxin-related protein
MVKVYGSKECPDCRAAEETLKKSGTSYEFRNLAELANLKEFLRMRDTLPLFIPVKENQGVGIPCFVSEGGTVTLDITKICK